MRSNFLLLAFSNIIALYEAVWKAAIRYQTLTTINAQRLLDKVTVI